MHLKSSAIILLTIFLLTCPAIAGDEVGDENDIIQGLKENAGGVYTVPAGTYILNCKESIKVPEGTTIQGTMSKSGKWLTIIEWGPDLKLGKQVPVFEASDNTKFLYLDILGNSENRPTVPYWNGHSGKEKGKKKGQGYDNAIGGKHFKNVEVAYNRFSDSLGDYFRFWYCENISFHDNYATGCGHDTFYGTQSEKLIAYNNYIEPMANSALRVMDCSGVLFHSNTIVVPEGGGPAGPGIQIQNDKGEMHDIEVCYNTIYSSYGPGFWVVGKTKTGKQSANIHHNVIMNAGTDRGIYWVGGMVISGYDNLKISNNVFDSCYRAGILYYAYNKAWGTEAHSDISENIFTNIQVGRSDSRGGNGIRCEIGPQSITSEDNCFWDNTGNDVEGCHKSSSDISFDPKKNKTPSGYTWDEDEEAWSCDGMPPTSLDYNPGGVYDNEDPITDEEAQEFEFDNFLDVLSERICTQVDEDENVILPDGIEESPTKALCEVEYRVMGNNTTTFVKFSDDKLRGVSEVVYEVDGKTATHTLMLGEKTSHGVVFTETSIWSGELDHTGDDLELPGKIDLQDITITCVTPKDTFQPIIEATTVKVEPITINPIMIGIFFEIFIGIFLLTVFLRY